MVGDALSRLGVGFRFRFIPVKLCRGEKEQAASCLTFIRFSVLLQQNAPNDDLRSHCKRSQLAPLLLSHTDCVTRVVPSNESTIQVRRHYPRVFPEYFVLVKAI